MPRTQIKQNPKTKKEKLHQIVPHCRAKCMSILNNYNSNHNFNLGMSNLLLVKKNIFNNCMSVCICGPVCISSRALHTSTGANVELVDQWIKTTCESPVVLAWVGTQQELMSWVWPISHCSVRSVPDCSWAPSRQSLSAPDGLWSLY